MPESWPSKTNRETTTHAPREAERREGGSTLHHGTLVDTTQRGTTGSPTLPGPTCPQGPVGRLRRAAVPGKLKLPV